jgi:ADP-ribose pyrophosphatase YjhB (NUDIX family)
MLSKTRLSATFRRFPWMVKVLINLYRVTLPRFTAGVNGVLLDDSGRVLLVEHVYHAVRPWGLPGGWVDRCEEPSDSVVREFREETGIEVQVVRPILVQVGQFWGSHLDMSFLLTCAAMPDSLYLSSELLDYGWFSLDDLPPLHRFDWQVLQALQGQMSVESSYVGK